MKQLQNGLWIALAFCLSACSSIRFDSAMPRESAVLKGFPSGIAGKYQLIDKVVEGRERFYNSLYYKQLPALDSFHIITAHIVVEEQLVYDIIDTRSYYKMPAADTARLGKEHGLAETYTEGAYIVYKEIAYDTLLDLQKKDELKFYNGAWYLNHALGGGGDEHDEMSWDILQMMMKGRDELTIGYTNERDKKKLRRFIISSKENVFPLVSMNDARFYRFVKRGGFRARYQFKRI